MIIHYTEVAYDIGGDYLVVRYGNEYIPFRNMNGIVFRMEEYPSWWRGRFAKPLGHVEVAQGFEPPFLR